MATKNIQLKNGDGELLMPKSNSENITHTSTGYPASSGSVHDALSYALKEHEDDVCVFENFDFGGFGRYAYIGSAGTWNNVKTGTHFRIPVSVGEKIKIKGNASQTTFYGWLSGEETSGTPSFSTTTKLTSLGANVERTLIVPNAETNWLYVVRSINANFYAPQYVQKMTSGTKVNSNTLSDVLVKNVHLDDDADLVISDESNNDIVQFSGGHIKTKHFDSSAVATDGISAFIRQKFDGKRCAIIGDSISTYNGYMPSGYAVYYPKGDVNAVNKTWWKIVCDTFNMTPVNCAWSGSKVTGTPKGATAQAGCCDIRVSDAGRNGNPDVILVFIGCNDWATDVSIGTWDVNDTIINDNSYSATDTITDFSAAYSLMLYKLQKAYPSALVYCCTLLDDRRRDGVAGYPSENSAGVTIYDYNSKIKKIASAMGCPVINLHDCGLNYANLMNYVVDEGLHPNAAGMEKMAKKVISELLTK